MRPVRNRGRRDRFPCGQPLRPAMRTFLATLLALAVPSFAPATPEVSDIKAVHRHGQTFVTWKDAAEGEAGAQYRYRLVRSEHPITDGNLAGAELCSRGILY